LIKAVLFDMDGTLVPVDINEFLPRYVGLLWKRFAHLVPQEKFAESLWGATGAMVRSQDTSRTMYDVFWQDFSARLGIEPDELKPVVGDFYETEFPQLKGSMVPDPRARQVVTAALNQGYEVVLATTPIFPGTAIIERARWGNIHDLPWKIITAYEEMHSSKPNPQYYSEVLARIGRKPDECVMVGNDTRDDLVAGTIGMRTFLADELILDRKTDYVPTWRGTLSDLQTLIERRFGL
jgi:FMN phosphatase YigB (HAD superfamily)